MKRTPPLTYDISQNKGYPTKKHKEASRTLATKVFRTDEHWPLKKHNGRAEAALIAYHEGKIRYEKESTQCHKA